MPITAVQSSGLLNQCFLPKYHHQGYSLFRERVRPSCPCSAEYFRKSQYENAPMKGRGERKAEEQLPIIAGQTAGLLNPRFMPIIISSFFSLLRSVLYPVAPAPLIYFANHNMIAQKWTELRLTFIQNIYTDTYIKACRTTRPEV